MVVSVFLVVVVFDPGHAGIVMVYSQQLYVYTKRRQRLWTTQCQTRYGRCIRIQMPMNSHGTYISRDMHL